MAKSPNKKKEVAEIKCAPCEYHFELVPEDYMCFGGGMYAENETKKELLLYGCSVDYGVPQFSGWKELKMLDEKYNEWSIIYAKNIEDLRSTVKVDITKK